MSTQSEQRIPRVTSPVILVIALCGVAASGTSFTTLEQRESRLAEASFELAAKERLAMVSGEFQRNVEAAATVIDFYGASNSVDRGEFRIFAGGVLERHPSVSALEWLPRIPASERELFESELSRFTRDASRISRLDDDGELVAARERAEYFPVAYVEPLEGNDVVLGFDHASDPHRWSTMMAARDSGNPVASEQISLFRMRDHANAGILVFTPVYRNGAATANVEQRRENLIGFTTAVLRVSDIVDGALRHFAPGGIDIYVFDTASGADAPPLHAYAARSRLGPFSPRSYVDLQAADARVIMPLEVGGRRYELIGAPTEAFLSQQRTWAATAALLVGLTFTALLVAYLYRQAGETARIARLVEQRTADLSEANASLAREIEDRRRSEEALRVSEERFDLAVRGSSDGIWDWDVKSNRVYYSPRFKALLGYAEADFADDFNSFESHLHPEDGRRVLRRIQSHLEQRTPYDIEYRLRTRAGVYRWFRARGQAIWDEDGQPTRMAGSLTDVTKAREMAIELEAAVAELGLQNASLGELKTSLELAVTDLSRSNQELDDFAYIASHDLKEPLRGIHNYSSFLLEDYEDLLDDDGRSKLVTLTRLTQRMETLIDSLLHFSRVGRVDLAVQETDLQAIVADVVESLQFSLDERGVELRIPRPLPSILADQARVGEIFRNLITNAIKYNDKPEKHVEIGWRQEPDGSAPEDVDPARIFYVRDNGIGIREKHLNSVFRIFKRLHGREKFGGGTGAGLTIVKKIVERHGGRIWVESTFGEGTTFYFTLEKVACHDHRHQDELATHPAG